MNVIRITLAKVLCLVLAGALVSLPVSAQAASPQADAAVAKLVELGVAQDEAQAQIAALDESELALLAEHLESQPAGGDNAGDVIVAFLVITGVVFITLIITDAVGITDIFPWVKGPNER